MHVRKEKKKPNFVLYRKDRMSTERHNDVGNGVHALKTRNDK
jgi:hypothetical protein